MSAQLRTAACILILGGFVALLAACSPAAPAAVPTLPPTPSPTDTPAPTLTPTPPPTPTPSITPTPTPALCSPLDTFAIPQLTEIVSNPFNPPDPGLDFPHHGADYSFYRYGSRVGMLGLPVHAALAGQVAGISENRMPFGNMILIETPLNTLPADLVAKLLLPTAQPTLPYTSPLTCPPLDPPLSYSPDQRSLYLLYAHLQDPPELQPAQAVTCGQAINRVGNTGNSINEHLHLEVRVGPSGIRLGSMAHYDASASPQEQATYCTWRISGLFQMIDPQRLFASQN